MRKFIVNSSLLIVHCFFLLSIINYLLPIVYAADSSPSADIQAKLAELKKEIASKAAQIKQEVNRKLKDKAYVGKVQSKSDTSLTLAVEGGPKLISINQDTIWGSNVKSKVKFSSKTIQLEDYMAALGDADETGVLSARKIILLPSPNSESKTFLWGQIISISDKLLTIRGNNFKNVAATLSVSSEVKINDFVILTGYKGKNDIFDARFVYVIPRGASLKPKKVVYPERSRGATPSAQTASPSATPKTPKPTSR